MEVLKEYFIAKHIDEIVEDENFMGNLQNRYPQISECDLQDIVIDTVATAVRKSIDTLEEYEQ